MIAPVLNMAQRIYAYLVTNLNTTVSSRASGSIWTQAKADLLNAAIDTRAAASSLSTHMSTWSSALATKLNALDKGQKLMRSRVINQSATFTLLNHSGSAGILQSLWIKLSNNGATASWSVSVSIDGQAAQTITEPACYATPGDAGGAYLIGSGPELTFVMAKWLVPMNVRFKSSCVVTVTRVNGALAEAVALYSTDI
jgi:hypothetical protein